MRLPLLALVGVLALGASACSEESAPYEDGNQALPLAGVGPEIEDAGVTVLSGELPDGATADQVTAALAAADVASPTATRPADVADGSFGFDATATAGLLSVVTDGPGSTVVLVFAGTDAAAVYAAGAPEVFTDAGVESEREAFLSGNLVGYAAGTKGRPDRLRDALEELGGTATSSESPSESPSDSPSGTASS